MDIYGIDGQPIIRNLKLNADCRHEEEMMKSNFIKLSFRHSKKRELPVGANILVDGIRYVLLDPYTPTQQTENRFLYEPEFQHPIMWLGKMPFIHKQGDTTSWATTVKKFDWTYTGVPATLANEVARYINWLGSVYPAFGAAVGTTWRALCTDDLPANAEFVFDSVDILSGAAEMANVCECEYHFDFEQKIFHFGTVSYLRSGDTVPMLKSGQNVGVASVSQSKEAYYNCFVVKGGTRNISQQSPSGDNVQVTERLSLDETKYPDSIIDIRKSESEPKLFKELLFDDIYPKMELYLYNPRERRCWLIDSDTGEKIETTSADGWYDSETQKYYKYYSKWYIRLAYQKDGEWHDYTINPDTDLIKDKPLSLAFQPNYEARVFTSPLIGREFELVYFKETTTEKEQDDINAEGFTAQAGDYRIVFLEGDVILPSTSKQGMYPRGYAYPDKENNIVTLFNIVVDEVYKEVAKDELEKAGKKAIARLQKDLNTYNLKANPVYFEKYPRSLYVGQSVVYSDGQDLNNGGTPYTLQTHIRKIVTRLDKPECKEISVGNEQIKGNISSLSDKVDEMSNGLIAGLTEEQFDSLVSIYGSRHFLSKEFNDVAQGTITFLRGAKFGSFLSGSTGAAITAGGDAEFRRLLARLGLTTGKFAEGLHDSGAHIDNKGNTEVETLFARKSAVIGDGTKDPDDPQPTLEVKGDTVFHDNISSPEFQSGFPGGIGWAIQRVEVENAAGEKEYRYNLEIDNANIRNTLRVYEFIISQLLGENDNRIFTAMLEVDHYDPATGKVWLSTHGGRFYNPFRAGDYIMVQQYQPGADMKSGGDGYITKHYELIIAEAGSGGMVDDNGDRLDWVTFYNFTPADGESTPAQLIAQRDTFCRVDSVTDNDRKGIIQIMTVGQNTPYLDVIQGLKTSPNDHLKGRFGALTGIRTDLFGWLEGFGAYLNNLYAVGKFFNAQTGESLNARIEATKERFKSLYSETTYNISDDDNFLHNGFFQQDLDGWGRCATDGSAAPDVSSDSGQPMAAYDPSTGQAQGIMFNGGLMAWKKDTRIVEVVENEGIKMLHLNALGISQDFSLIKKNGTHEEMNQEYSAIVDDPSQQGYVAPYSYSTDEDGNLVETNNSDFDTLTSNETAKKTVADSLYFGIRILPITDGTLTIRFIKNGSYTGITRNLTAAHDWQLIQFSDENEAVKWNYEGSGKLLVSYTGECNIRFVALMSDPIVNAQIEYSTLFEQTSRRLTLAAIRDSAGHKKAMSQIQVQYNAIMQTVTGDKEKSDDVLSRVLGISYDPKTGTYVFPEDWDPEDDNYATWRIQTKAVIDDLATKWDPETGQLTGYSNRTQTADFIREVIAGTASIDQYEEWGQAGEDLIAAMVDFNEAWGSSLTDGKIDARERGQLKALRISLEEQFKAAQAEYNKIKLNSLVADTDELTAMNNAYNVLVGNNSNGSYYQMLTAIDNVVNATGDIKTTDQVVITANQKIDAFNTNLNTFVAAMANCGVKADKSLKTMVDNTKKQFEDYQKALDDEIEAAHEGWTFLNFISNTKTSSIQLIALLDSEGNLTDYSTREQTATFIREVIAGTATAQSYSSWGDAGEGLINAMSAFKSAWDEALGDGTIDAQERGYLNSLSKSIQTQYDAAISSYNKAITNSLIADTTELTTLKTKKTALDTAYSELNTAITNVLNIEGNIDVSGDNKDAVQAVTTKFTAFDTALKNFHEALSNAGVKADANLLTKVNAVTTNFANYQKSLDDKIKEAYPNRTFISWVSDTMVSSMQIKALLDSEGNLTDYSTRTQTATDISSALKSYTKSESSLNDSDAWEQGTTNEIAGYTYHNIKNDSNSRIRTKDLWAINKTTKVSVSSGYQVFFVYFRADKTVCSTTGAGWYEGSNISVDPPAGAQYMAILVRNNSASEITPSIASSANVKVASELLVTKAEISLFIEDKDGVTISHAKIAADQIDFETGSMEVKNGGTRIFYLDGDGNLELRGNIYASNILGNVGIGSGTNKMYIRPNASDGAELVGYTKITGYGEKQTMGLSFTTEQQRIGGTYQHPIMANVTVSRLELRCYSEAALLTKVRLSPGALYFMDSDDNYYARYTRDECSVDRVHATYYAVKDGSSFYYGVNGTMTVGDKTVTIKSGLITSIS